MHQCPIFYTSVRLYKLVSDFIYQCSIQYTSVRLYTVMFNFYTRFRFYTPVSNFIHQGLILCTSVRFKLVGSKCRHLCPVIDHRVRFVTLKSDFGDQRPILDTSFRLRTLVQIFDTSFPIQRIVSFSHFPLQNALRLKRLLLIFFPSGFFSF